MTNIEGGKYVVNLAVGVEASGNTTLIAATAGYSIRVIYILLVVDADVSIYFADTDGTDICGTSTVPMALAGNGGFTAANEKGVMETPIGKGLVINCSSAEEVSGVIRYILDKD